MKTYGYLLVLVLILVLILSGCLDGSEGTFIRIKNEGPILVEDFALVSEVFGSLEVAEISRYKQVLQATTSPNYSFIANGQQIDVTFIVPGDPLGDGFFTYQLTFELDSQGEVINLDLQVGKD